MIRDAPPGATAPGLAWLGATRATTVISITRPALRATREDGKRTLLHRAPTRRGEVLPHRIATTPGHGPTAAVPTTMGMVPRQVVPAARAVPQIGRHALAAASTTHRPVRAPTVRIARVPPTVHRGRTKAGLITTKAGVLILRIKLHGSQLLTIAHVLPLLPLATTAIPAGEAA